MTISGEVEVKRDSQILWRADSVCLEWIRVTFSEKVERKTWTSWEVRAISGTRRMTDFPERRVERARER